MTCIPGLTFLRRVSSALYPVSSILPAARRHLALLLIASLPAFAQSPNRNLILLDPAHGGSDLGTSFSGAPEKDLTRALANTLRTLLIASNFTVATTREADQLLASDQRAGFANHLHPAACLILHATGNGNGVHLLTSSLAQPAGTSSAALPWNTAQAVHLSQSRALSNTLGLALLRVKIPVSLSPAALRPLDNLTCAAVALEIAPFVTSGQVTPPTDPTYQRRVAEAVAVALVNWRNALPAGAAQ